MPSSHEYFADNPQFPAKLIIGTLFIGAFLGYLNETLLNVALSKLMTEFAVGKNTVQWMTTGFLLIMGAVTPITANIIQWFHTRTIALLTLGIFLTGSLICAFAPSFSILLAGRLVQAVAAAFSLPLLMNAILAIYPPQQRGRAMSLVAVIFTAAPAIGPTLSGIIVDALGWRYLFLLTTPLVFIALLLVAVNLKTPLIPITRPKIDGLSACLSVLGFGGLVYAASQFTELTLEWFVGILLASLGIIAWFIQRQLQLAEPLLNLKTFAYPQFRYAMMILAGAFFLFLGLELLLPMYTQQVLLLSGAVTGFILMPASIAEAIFAPIFGTLLDKKGGRWVALPGAMLMVCSLSALWWYADAHSQALPLAVLFAAFAVAVSSAVTGETHGLNHLPPSLNPHGTAIINTIMPISGALGAAFFIGITQIGEQAAPHLPAPAAMLNGIQLALACAALLSVLVFSIATRIRSTSFQAHSHE